MLRETLTALLAPVVQNLGLELWELEYSPRSNGGLLRLYIDSSKGIDVDDCARVSHAVSEVLDTSDPIPGYYTLEVSSPGLDRVLRTYEHFARFTDETVQVEMKLAIKFAGASRKRFKGRLLAADEHEIRLEVDSEQVALPLAGIHKARLAPDL